MTTVSYLRQSRDSEDGIKRQRERVATLADRLGLRIDREYVDNDVSASIERLAGTSWHRMLTDIRRGAVTHVLAMNTDRLTRDPQDILTLGTTGVTITTEAGPLELVTADGMFTSILIAAVAKFEATRKAERQRSANDQRRRNGIFFSGGVRLSGYTLKGEMVPDEAVWVREVFERFNAGDSLKGIARWLTEQGIEPRSQPKLRGNDPGQRHLRDVSSWPASSVRTLLINPRYAGRSMMIGEDYAPGSWEPGKWEPIIDGDLFDAVQARLADPRRVTNRVGTARKHLGSGLWQCSECGAGVITQSSRYTCPTGGHGSRSIIPVDTYIVELIEARVTTPEVAAAFVPADGVEAKRISTAIADLRARRSRREADYENELIDGLIYKTTTDKLDAQIKRLDNERLALGAGNEAAAILGAAHPGVAFAAASLERKRLLIDAIATVRLHPAPRYSKVFDPMTVEVVWKT